MNRHASIVVVLFCCLTINAMDMPCTITPEYFVAQIEGCTRGETAKGKMLLSQCLPKELRSLWQYIVTHEKKIKMGGVWTCAMLDLNTKKGAARYLRSYLNAVCTDKDLPLNATAINHIMKYLSAECLAKRRNGSYEWEPIVPVDIALECLELLIAKRVVMNCDTIFDLVKSDKVALMGLLLRKGVVDANGITRRNIPLWHLARSTEMFNLLRQYGNTQMHSVDEDGLTVLHRYARDSDIFGSVPELLLRLGSNVNVQDQHGDTPLHLAVRRNKRAAQAWFVSKGADCFIKNSIGEYAVPIQLSKAYTREIVKTECEELV